MLNGTAHKFLRGSADFETTDGNNADVHETECSTKRHRNTRQISSVNNSGNCSIPAAEECKNVSHKSMVYADEFHVSYPNHNMDGYKL